MNNIEELFKDKSKEEISAFAFNVGRLLEIAVDNEIYKLKNENAFMKGQILQFRNKLSKGQPTILNTNLLYEYDLHFRIQNIII